jgi:hypothetical protein
VSSTTNAKWQKLKSDENNNSCIYEISTYPSSGIRTLQEFSHLILNNTPMGKLYSHFADKKTDTQPRMVA